MTVSQHTRVPWGSLPLITCTCSNQGGIKSALNGKMSENVRIRLGSVISQVWCHVQKPRRHQAIPLNGLDRCVAARLRPWVWYRPLTICSFT